MILKNHFETAPFLLPGKSRFRAPLLTFFEAGPAYTGETPNEGREAMTTVYLDARFALDLAVNYCLLACAARSRAKRASR